MRAWVIKTKDGYWSYWKSSEKSRLNEATLFATEQDAIDTFTSTHEYAVPVVITLVGDKI